MDRCLLYFNKYFGTQFMEDIITTGTNFKWNNLLMIKHAKFSLSMILISVVLALINNFPDI